MVRPSSALQACARFAWYFVGFSAIGIGVWLNSFFGRPTLQQLLYHLHYFDSLIFDANRAFVISFAIACVLIPALVTCLWLLVERWFGALKSRIELNRQMLAVVSYFPVALAIGAVASLAFRTSAFGYLTARVGPDEFAARYVDPATVELRATKPKNLVLIYVESLETTYSDARIFGEDLLSDLNALPGFSFERLEPAAGTQWTMAGLVSTQCGVPLQFMGNDDVNDGGARVRSFLPGATCLGDVLDRFGYTNVFVGGASLEFAGKRKFLDDHGYDASYGYREYASSGTALHGTSDWGMFDDDLFVRAREQLAQLHAEDRPFNLTLLTLDTHSPRGHYSQSCLQRGARTFEDIVKCTSAQVASFVDWARESGYLSDTNVVVVGDHLAMVNPVSAKLDVEPRRTIYNKFISADASPRAAESILPFDMLPTILEFLGFDVVGDRLALGNSGFAPSNDRQSASLRPEATLDILFSPSYERLWMSPRPTSTACCSAETIRLGTRPST